MANGRASVLLRDSGVDFPVVRDAFSPTFRGDDLVTPPDAVGAKQSFKDECDINNIVKTFSPQTGEFSHMSLKAPFFGDVVGVGNFRDLVAQAAEATASFMQLPAEVRRRFANDPLEFVEFAADPANMPELEKMGLTVSENVVSAVEPPEPPPSVGGTAVAGPAPGAPPVKP